MAIIRRIDTVMTGVAGSPYYNSLYFTKVNSVEPGQLQTAVGAFWQSLLFAMDNALEVRVQAEVPNVDDATGDIVSFEQGVGSNLSGLSNSPRLPAATQALIRLRTDTVAAGRRIQGKIYIPALCAPVSSEVPESEFVDQLTTSGNALISATATLGPLRVLSRKNLTSAVVTQTVGWEQWSVLRSRRD